MIHLQNLCYSVVKNGEPSVVLDDITATLPTKGSFGILGVENSGKSALMRLLAGFALPQNGQILRHARLSFPVGYDGIFKRALSPRDNLQRFADAFGPQIKDIIRYVAANTGLSSNFDVPLGKLPQDLQARFVFVATYALPFDCYLVDERFSPNDPDFKSTCQRMMEERAEAAGLILATRRTSIVQRFCSSAAILENGKLVFYDRVEDAVQEFKSIESRIAASKLEAVAPVDRSEPQKPRSDSPPRSDRKTLSATGGPRRARSAP